MFKILFKVLFATLKAIATIVLTPINQLVVNYFPSVAILINNFNSFLNTYVVQNLGFFGNLIPPVTKNIILFYLAYLILRFVAVLNVHLIMKVFHIIKNIKVW